MTTIADALEALNEAGQTATKMDAELGAATERLGVRDLSSAQARVSAAHTLLSQQGRNLAAIEKTLIALAFAPGTPVKPPPAPPAQPTESIVAWAKRVHPEVDIGNGYALAIIAGSRTNYDGVWPEYMARYGGGRAPDIPTPPATPPPATPVDLGPLPNAPTGVQIVDFNPAERPPYRMAGLFLRGPNMAIRFRTSTASTRGGRATSFEHRGEQRYRQTAISLKPGDMAGAAPASTSTQIWFSVGIALPGCVRLEPNTVYYLNLRGVPWNSADASEEFAVDILSPPLP